MPVWQNINDSVERTGHLLQIHPTTNSYLDLNKVVSVILNIAPFKHI